jgi:NMD protein affecting ribosome stability and mRNA decay
MKTGPSKDCIYCGKPHEKTHPRHFEACAECEETHNQRMIEASSGLDTASCPRCDLLFSVAARPTLTDEEREALSLAYSRLTADSKYDKVTETLRNLLERIK